MFLPNCLIYMKQGFQMKIVLKTLERLEDLSTKPLNRENQIWKT